MKFLSLILASCLFFSPVQAQAKNFLFDATSFDPQPVMVAAANNLVPTGTVMIWTQEIIPEGWLECNGQPVPSNYNLYKTMKKTPDYRNIFLQGANGNLGQKIEAGLPNIEGKIGEVLHGGGTKWWLGEGDSGAIKRHDFIGTRDWSPGGSPSYSVTFNASRSNPIYGKSITVQPPAITVKYIIKAE